MRIHGVYLLLTGTLLSACSTCPKDINAGQLRFVSPQTNPYRTVMSLTYHDDAGETLKLVPAAQGDGLQNEKLITRTLCQQNYLFRQVEFFDSPWYWYHFRPAGKSSGPALEYNYRLNLLNYGSAPAPGDTIISETLSIANYFSTAPGTFLQVHISDRNNPNAQTLIRKNIADYRFITDTLLANKSYKNLYCPRQQPSFFFSIAKGVVAFKEGSSRWWYLAD